MKRNNLIYLLSLITAIIFVSCSTTRRIPDGELLYTGIKKMEVIHPEGEKMPSTVNDALDEAIFAKPNNSLFGSARYRSPFPIGLWVYNNWDENSGGLKGWLYKNLVDEPILVSDVRPEVRVKMLDDVLKNNGYFQGTAKYELVNQKNPKKAKIKYDVTTGPAYTIDSIEYLPDTTALNHMIDSVARRSKYLVKGVRYATDSLSQVRIDIANALRNKGYYYFRPEFIEYLADSTINNQKIALKLAIASNVPEAALSRYKTGNITMRVLRNEGGGNPDTIKTRRGTLIQMSPSRFRHKLVDECVTFRQGKYFSVRDMDRTQSYFSRLGIFSGISIDVRPDTTSADRSLDVEITCTLDKPLEASIEVNATSKSNSYLGPGVILGVTNRNLFGGGEQLSVTLNGAYEWQTGSESGRSIFNSYEIGINGSLSFPRLLAPKFIPRRNRAVNTTRISLGADLLNRPHYFKIAEFNTSIDYEWRVTRRASSKFTPLRLSYNKLLHTTTDFDSIMSENPAIAQSFQTQFIPQMMYSYTYDRRFGKNNTLNWTITLQEGGNIFWAAYEAFGGNGEKKLFGTPFSQFVKGTTQLVWNHRIIGNHWLVSRAAVGAAHAYGNSSQVPYSEQFYVGGANSVRAFTVRSIGPGRYKAPSDLVNGYFDQTGTFKFEFNVEYRFPILGSLHGAIFLDTGNIWLLKEDPQRPGGRLNAKRFLEELAVGTGFGVRYDIGMLVVRGDLGIGIHAPYDTGKSGYYNMTSFEKSLAFHLAIGYPF